MKNTLIKNINPEQILKLKELQLEERENFILENKIDRRLVDKLGIALNEEDLQKIKKRGE